MSDPPAQAELPVLIEEGLRMVRQRLQASPGFSIYLSVQRQLSYLKETIAAGQVPTAEKLDSLTLGVYAAREFETPDPDFADVLFKVNYLANRMS
jgi:Tsi6